MSEHRNGNPANGMKGRQTEEGVGGAKTIDGTTLGHHHEGELVFVVRVNVADGGAGHFQWKVLVPLGQIIALL